MKRVLYVIVSILAVYRLSRLITREDGPFFIFPKLQSFTDRKRAGSGNSDWSIWTTLDEVFRCPYCIGVWVSAFFSFLLDLTLKEKILYTFGISGGQFLLQKAEERYLDEY